MKNDAEDTQTDVLLKASSTYDLIDDTLGMFEFFFVATVVESYMSSTLLVVYNIDWCSLSKCYLETPAFSLLYRLLLIIIIPFISWDKPLITMPKPQ